jgi:hypothetical protein
MAAPVRQIDQFRFLLLRDTRLYMLSVHVLIVLQHPFSIFDY